MLRYRFLSALILVPTIAWLTWLGKLPFLALIMVVGALAGWEYFQLVRQGGHHPATVLGIPWTLLIIAQSYPATPFDLSLALTLGLLATLLFALFQAEGLAMRDWAMTAGGALYLGVFLSHFVALRELSQGLAWIAIAVLTTWAVDTGAYFIGTYFGRHKLWPRLSPKKSWEGAVGGWLAGVMVCGALSAFYLPLTLTQGLVLGGVAGVMAAFGDLVESLLKREMGAKDSGNLIPGHGGVLDRIDSLLFVVPVFYYAARWLAGV